MPRARCALAMTGFFTRGAEECPAGGQRRPPLRMTRSAVKRGVGDAAPYGWVASSAAECATARVAPTGGYKECLAGGRPQGSPLRRVTSSALRAGDREGRPYGGACVYIIYLYNKAVFFCDVKKIFCRRGKSAAKERDFQIGSGGVRTGEVSPCARCRCKGAGGIRALFAMQKHSKIRNVPFPRPYGATGNDAQKTSCTGICAFSWCSVPA